MNHPPVPNPVCTLGSPADTLRNPANCKLYILRIRTLSTSHLRVEIQIEWKGRAIHPLNLRGRKCSDVQFDAGKCRRGRE